MSALPICSDWHSSTHLLMNMLINPREAPKYGSRARQIVTADGPSGHKWFLTTINILHCWERFLLFWTSTHLTLPQAVVYSTEVQAGVQIG